MQQIISTFCSFTMTHYLATAFNGSNHAACHLQNATRTFKIRILLLLEQKQNVLKASFKTEQLVSS